MNDRTRNAAGDDGEHPFHDVRAFYRSGEEILLSSLPTATSRVIARRATGEDIEAELLTDARFAGLDGGTYALQALDAAGGLLAEELTTVGAHQGERPVHGFATSFRDEDIPSVLAWHRKLRTTVVQVYDWMASYTEPLGPSEGWNDPSNRPVSLQAFRATSRGAR